MRLCRTWALSLWQEDLPEGKQALNVGTAALRLCMYMKTLSENQEAVPRALQDLNFGDIEWALSGLE